MLATEETIDAMLESSGELRLPPGPVKVTIRSATPVVPRPGLADVIREIAAEQRACGYPGRTAEDISAEAAERLDEDAERDRMLDAARRKTAPETP